MKTIMRVSRLCRVSNRAVNERCSLVYIPVLKGDGGEGIADFDLEIEGECESECE